MITLRANQQGKGNLKSVQNGWTNQQLESRAVSVNESFEEQCPVNILGSEFKRLFCKVVFVLLLLGFQVDLNLEFFFLTSNSKANQVL